MPKKGKRKGKGREAVPDVPGKPVEVPAGITEVPGIQAGPASHAPAVGQKQGIESPQSVEESSKFVVPSYPSTSTMPPEEALRRMAIELYEPPSTAGWPFAKRPGVGAQGRKIKLEVNRFTVDIPRGYIYHYDVVVYIKPNKPPSGAAAEKKKFRCLNTRESREVLECAVQNAQTCASHLLHQVLPAYDGRKNLYTRKRLKLNAGETKEIPVAFKSKNYVIEIKPVDKKGQDAPSISLEPLHQLFEGRALSITEEMRMAVMALETILRHGPALKYVPVYRSFYYCPREGELEPLSPGREIWLGYHQSLQISQWKPMITIDTSATVFYESSPVVNRLMSIINPRVSADRIEGELRRIRGLSGRQIQAFVDEMKNVLVEVIHLEYPRKYRVQGITQTAACDTYFNEEVNGKQVRRSVAEYFGNKYPKHRLKYPNLPCIMANPNKKTFLPFEVCKIASGQPLPVGKELSDDDRRKLIKQTSFVPDLKFRKIKDRVELTKRDLECPSFGSRSFAGEFGIRINTTFTKLEGRVLDPPRLMYSPQREILPENGQWNMNNKHFFKSCEPVSRWILINFTSLSDGQMKSLADSLIEGGALLGIKFARPTMRNFGRDASPALCIGKETQQERNFQLAIIIVPPRTQNKTIYREIKNSCETKFGLMTQCIAERNARECKKSVISNLCQKINAKLGGKNNSIADRSKPQVFKRPVIIIGADCTHPSPGDTVELSVAAVVGSLDSAPSKYKTAVRIQAPEETKEKGKKAKEIILQLKDMVKEVLLAFFQYTRIKPEKIIFYRDGVSEGEFRQVLEKEVTQIRAACREMESGYKPGITFIVVGKRHHTRFRPEDRGDPKLKGNVPPGTTVDTVVTHPLYFDYFMCSHLGIQGTSKPAHYTVLWDDNNFSADQLHQLTYYMCYTYTRCTQSISIPCPVMYAHLAAYRAKLYLVHRKEEMKRAGHGETASGIREMIEPIKVHRNIENEMYFT